MTIQRMDNVGVVVDDLAAATAFFVEDIEDVLARLHAHGAGQLS
jgi:hypothetical protein